MNRFSYTRHRQWLRAEQLEDRLLLAIDFVADINTFPGNRLPTESVAVDGELYFQAFDPINGSELWKSDGTPEGCHVSS